jgi:roadblock/LC7 domain-containing protein
MNKTKEQTMSKEMYEILAHLERAAELMFEYGISGYAEEVGMIMTELEESVREVE